MEMGGQGNTVELGGNISLTGFSELEPANMIVLKKIVGNYARKMSDALKDFQKLSLTMKKIHEREKSEKYELHAKLVADRTYVSEVIDRNLYVAVDSALKKIMSSIE